MINRATGERLWNAAVMIDGTSIATTTDRDGSFALNAPAGEQTVSVSYTGLDTQREKVTVVAGSTVDQDFGLTSEVYKLDSFVVQSSREGNALALQQQRVAINSTQITAVDAYGAPAANPGELIQRFPDVATEIVGSEVRTLYIRGMAPDFMVTQVNGNQMATAFGTSATRVAQIEQFGTGNIEAIELIKAPRPEHDANALAGFVNMIPRRAFDTSHREIELTAGTMWRHRDSRQNPYQDNPDGVDLIGVRYTDAFNVFGGKRNLGVTLNVNRRRSSTTQDESGSTNANGPSSYYFDATRGPLHRFFGSGDIFYPAIATNVGLSFDYKLGEGSYLYLITGRNTNDQYQRANRWTIQAPSAATSFTAGSTPDHVEVVPTAGGVGQLWSYNFTKRSINYFVNPGLSLKLMDGTATLQASAFYSHAKVYYPRYTHVDATTSAVAPGGFGWKLDIAGDPYEPTFTQTSGPSLYDASTYTPSYYERFNWWSTNDVSNGRADFEKRFNLSMPVTVKTGLKYQVDDRAQYRRWEQRTWTGPTGVGPYVESTYKQANGNYGPFPFIQPPGLGGDKDVEASGYFVLTDRNQYDNLINSSAADAKFKEKILAGYVQAQMKFGRLSVLTGARIERTSTEGSGVANNLAAATNFDGTLPLAANLARAQARLQPIARSGSYSNIFPGLHLSFDAGKNTVLKASYNLSITRPPVANIIPIATVNNDAMTVSVGNPELKPYTADNFEVSVEHYFEPLGIVSVEGFYKRIHDYIATAPGVTIGSGSDNGFGGAYAGYTLTQARNVGAAHIKGFSVRWEQRLGFLPGIGKNFGLMANYTALQAEGQFTGTSTSRTLPNEIPHSWNAGVSYVDSRFDLRLLANYRGEFTISYQAPNVNTTNTAEYRDARLFYDFKGLYHINHTYSLFFDAFNLTNEPSNTQTIAGRKTYALYQGIGFDLGVNARF